MEIGILGSGKVGRALGAWMASRDFSVAFSSRTEEHARQAAHHAGPHSKAVDLPDLVRGSDVVFLTVPYGQVSGILEQTPDMWVGKIVVDVTNPITPDHFDLTIGHDTSGAEEIARRIPKAHVVKAFNAVFAEVYEERTSHIGDQQITIFYAGEDRHAKLQVRHIIERLGFDAVDAGELKMARFLEPLSLLNIHLGRRLDYGTQIGFSLARRKRT